MIIRLLRLTHPLLEYMCACACVSVCVWYLGVIGPQHNPATEAVSHVNDRRTAGEANHVGKRSRQSHDQDLRDGGHNMYLEKTKRG